MIPNSASIENKPEVVSGSMLYNMGRERTELLLIPNNMGELFIPFTEGIKLKLIGNVKEVKLTGDQCYFLKPRRRGMEVICEENARFLVVNVNPVYVSCFCADLNEIFNGVHQMDLSVESIMKLKKAVEPGTGDVENILKHERNFRNEYNPIDQTVAESIVRIRDSSGTIKVKEIYSSLNVSKSKLEQHFNKQIGLSPKEFCKIEKINFFINTYKQNLSQNLTELTYKCGYYDQSHLIKDFRYFLDTSPKKFFALNKSM